LQTKKERRKKMRNYEESENVETVEFYDLDQRNEAEQIDLLWDLLACYMIRSDFHALKKEYRNWKRNDLESFECHCFDELVLDLEKILEKEELWLRIEDSTLFIENEISGYYEKETDNFFDDISCLEKCWHMIDIQPAY
jgi:hypothetical protein